MKIRLQIPWWRTWRKSPEIRAQQANSGSTSSFHSGIEALSHLTKAGCASSPALLSWKKDEQASNGWVPGGYKLSILMEKVPGCDPSDAFDYIPRHERDSLRKTFKSAWLETVRCGVVHLDEAIYNLIWDKEGDKCYLVDCEHWYFPDKRTVWEDRNYISWHLAQAGPSHDLFNMSDWEL